MDTPDTPNEPDERRLSVRNWVTCPYCENPEIDIEIWGGGEVVFNCDECNHTATFSVE